MCWQVNLERQICHKKEKISKRQEGTENTKWKLHKENLQLDKR